MDKRSSLIVILFTLLLILIVQEIRNRNEEISKIGEANFCRLDSIAYESNFGWSTSKVIRIKWTNFGKKNLFFPIKGKVKTYFLNGTIADLSLSCSSFVGYQSGTFVYIFDIYRTKSEKFHDEVYKIQKRINASEVTTDPRATKKWIYSLREYKFQSLKDFIVHVCFLVKEEKIFIG